MLLHCVGRKHGTLRAARKPNRHERKHKSVGKTVGKLHRAALPPQQADPYLETREREELFVKQIVDAVENSLKQALPLFLSGLTAGMAQREPQIRASFPAPENSQPDSDVDWDFLGE